MRVLVACEFSGTVRDAFAAKGHDAWSCDLEPTEKPGQHIQGDALDVISAGVWDLLIAHPPCTYLSRAGARWWGNPERKAFADAAANFVMAIANAAVPRIAIENPIGQLNSRWRKPDQTIQPWWFGEPFSKATCLWLKSLAPLVPTHTLTPYKPLLPSNTGAGRRKGQRSHPGHTSSAKDASRTFPGVAAAMAEQWGAESTR